MALTLTSRTTLISSGSKKHQTAGLLLSCLGFRENFECALQSARKLGMETTVLAQQRNACEQFSLRHNFNLCSQTLQQLYANRRLVPATHHGFGQMSARCERLRSAKGCITSGFF